MGRRERHRCEGKGSEEGSEREMEPRAQVGMGDGQGQAA